MSVTKLPRHIKVSVKKSSQGALLVNLPEYDLHTQVDDPTELVFMINDLIYCFFDVPKNLQSHFTYSPLKMVDLEVERIKKMTILASPEIYDKYLHG